MIRSVFCSVRSSDSLSPNKKSTSLFGLTFAQSELWTERKTNPQSEVTHWLATTGLQGDLVVSTVLLNDPEPLKCFMSLHINN